MERMDSSHVLGNLSGELKQFFFHICWWRSFVSSMFSHFHTFYHRLSSFFFTSRDCMGTARLVTTGGKKLIGSDEPSDCPIVDATRGSPEADNDPRTCQRLWQLRECLSSIISKPQIYSHWNITQPLCTTSDIEVLIGYDCVPRINRWMVAERFWERFEIFRVQDFWQVQCLNNWHSRDNLSSTFRMSLIEFRGKSSRNVMFK